MAPKRCSVHECPDLSVAKSYCDNHYRHFRKYGDPLITKPRGAQPGSTNGFKKGNPSRPGPRPTQAYNSVHNQLHRKRGRAVGHTCACGQKAQGWAYDHSDPQELKGTSRGYEVTYSRDLDKYRAMCNPCHVEFDTSYRVFKLLQKGTV